MRNSSHPVSFSTNEILNEISTELEEIGINYVGHGVLDEKGNHTGYFSHKEWEEKYVERGYFYKDPILKIFNQSFLTIIDWTRIENITKNNEILAERTRYTGIISGITVVSTIHNYKEFLNLGFSTLINPGDFLRKNHDLVRGYSEIFRHFHTYQRLSQN